VRERGRGRRGPAGPDPRRRKEAPGSWAEQAEKKEGGVKSFGQFLLFF